MDDQRQPGREPMSPPNPKAPLHRTAVHSADFAFVNWFGNEYRFSKRQQRNAIRVLWAEWEKGKLGLSEKTIGDMIGSSNERFRLVHVFREKDGTIHPAWGTMIQSCGRGLYRLLEPPISP